MDALPCNHSSSADPRSEETDAKIFRQYYTEKDFILSPEGILKVISALACVISPAVFLSSEGVTCPGVTSLQTTAVLVSMVSAAASAVLYAGAGLQLALYAPKAWLLSDIIVSTLLGVLLLIMSVLTMMSCDMTNVVSYVHGPLGIVNAALLTGSAVITYIAVMQLWDKSHTPHQQPQSLPTEQDV